MNPWRALLPAIPVSGVAATLHSTIMPTTELIRRKAAIAGKEISIQSTVIENVGNLLAENKGDLYDEMVGEQLRLLLEENEVVVLAQASMARAGGEMAGGREEPRLPAR